MKFSRSTFITLLIILMILVVAGYFTYNTLQKSKIEHMSDATAFKALSSTEDKVFTGMNGEVVDLSDFFGRVMLVHSWASWCPSCAEELRQLSAVASEYDQDEVVVIAVNRAEDRFTAERYLNTYNLQPKVELILDPSDSFYASIGGYAMPETVVYGKDGEIILHVRGNIDAAKIRNTLETALNE